MSRPRTVPHAIGPSPDRPICDRLNIMKKMTEREIRETRKRFRAALATQACEGIELTDEEQALFNQMIDDGLPPDERLKKINTYIAEKINGADDTSE